MSKREDGIGSDLDGRNDARAVNLASSLYGRKLDCHGKNVWNKKKKSLSLNLADRPHAPDATRGFSPPKLPALHTLLSTADLLFSPLGLVFYQPAFFWLQA